MIKLQDSGTNEFKTILILADNGFTLKNSFNNLNEVQNTINKEIATYGYNLLEADHSILFFLFFRQVLCLTMEVSGPSINVFVNGEKILTFTTTGDLIPTRYEMDTQDDRSSIEYLNTDIRLY